MDTLTLFRLRLRRLKVLDGVSVNADETSKSREAYSGKLTRDIVVEKAKQRALSDVARMDFTHEKLRDVSVLQSLELHALRELNLDHNHLTSFDYILSLTGLVVLRLNHNRIET